MKSPDRNIHAGCPNEECPKPFSKDFTPSEFEAWIEKGEFDCPKCGSELSVEGVQLECHICEAEIEYFDLEHISLLLDERCNNCAGRPEWDADFYSIRIVGSWSSEYDTYD